MNSRELCESGILWMSGRCISSNRPPPGNVRKIRSEPLTFILIFQVRPRVEVLLVEGAHQFDVHSPDCDMVKRHCVHLSDSGLELSNSAPGSPQESLPKRRR